jgi:biotin operon repressor
VKRYVEQRIGTIRSNEVIAKCPAIGRSAVLNSIKKLVDEGVLIKQGEGRSTFYIKVDTIQ